MALYKFRIIIIIIIITRRLSKAHPRITKKIQNLHRKRKQLLSLTGIRNRSHNFTKSTRPTLSNYSVNTVADLGFSEGVTLGSDENWRGLDLRENFMHLWLRTRA